MTARYIRTFVAGLVLIVGAPSVSAQASDLACAEAPTSACLLQLATAVALSEPSPGDRDVALMRISNVLGLLGDAEALGGILAAISPGARADIVRANLALALATSGAAAEAFEAAAGMDAGWRRDSEFTALAGRLAAQGRAAEAEALAAIHAAAGAEGPVRRGLFEAALASGDRGRAEALLAAMAEADRALSRPQLVAAMRAAGDGAAVARVLAAVPPDVDALEALRLAVAAGQIDDTEALLRRIAAVGGSIADAGAIAVGGPQGDRLADLAMTLAGSDAEALGRIGQTLAEGGHVAAAQAVADRLAGFSRDTDEAAAAEARLWVLWALVTAQRQGGDVDGTLATLAAIDAAPDMRLDYPFPSRVPRERVATLIAAGRIDAAQAALAQIWDPFERAEALILIARAEATDAATDATLLAGAATAVRAVREVPTGFGGTHDASVQVAWQLASLARAAADLQLDIGPPLAAEALARIQALPANPSYVAEQMTELARALLPR